ncbi:uncharacterized protein [Linepithema humile]|uniref:uncharacterized protein n=1 Tax=Linepithema humile TaxID=83485 RepID=UPI00351F6139
MEWSNEKTIEFLELYEKETLLWNPKHISHKDRNAVNDSWKKIEAILNISVKELKKKKNVLLATYRKLARKVQDSTKTGSGASDVFKPNWFAYENMAKFLHSIYTPATTINSEEMHNMKYYMNDDDDDDDDDDDNGNEDEVACLEEDSEKENLENKTKRKTTMQIPTEKARNKKQKLSKTDPIKHQMTEAFKILKTVAKKHKKTEPLEKDQCALYADLLCSKLRSFDENLREIAMLEIYNLLFRLKKQNMSSQQQPHYQYNITPGYAQNYSQPLHSTTTNIPFNYEQHDSPNFSQIPNSQSSEQYNPQTFTSTPSLFHSLTDL